MLELKATFAVTHGDDPAGLYLKARVDTDDIDEVLEVVIDRLLEVQIEEYLPVYVIPLPTSASRAAAGRADPHAAPVVATAG